MRAGRVSVINLSSKIEDGVIPEPNSGCWLWCRSVDRYGYGKIGGGGRATIGAHRAAWLAYRGDIPDEMHVLHRCDVRSCVNPLHLFLGSNDDNVADRLAKGRGVPVRGERNARAKLTEAKVASILVDSRAVVAIAADAGVTPTTIYAIRQRKAWRHLLRRGD